MATLILVGGRDAALAAAKAAGHRVILVSDRPPLRRQKRDLRSFVHAEFGATTEADVSGWIDELVERVNESSDPVKGVLATTERAVLPAAIIRRYLTLEGNSVECAHSCRNKIAMKHRIREAGLPCTDFTLVNGRSSPMGLIRQLGLPLVLKPLDSSGSRGSVVARCQEDVAAHLVSGMVAETYVHGLEMSVESFVFQGRVLFTNLTEYLLPLWANIVPATLDEQTRTDVLALNAAVINALGIRQGMTHLELFLTPSGPIFSEIAIRPPGGYLMDLIGRSYGFDPWQTALDLEMGLEASLPHQASTFSGMWLLHPGQGIVRHVSGKRACRQIAGIREVSCRVEVGDVLAPRQGSGESAGYFIAEGSTRSDVVKALDQARKTLLIELEPLRE